LADYLKRKIRERGWAGDEPPDIAGLVERMAERRYVDDRAFAEARVGAMARRGLGARRVKEALRHAGVEGDDAFAVEATIAAEAGASAVAFARRKRIGPFAREQADRALLDKQLGAMLRAGHPLDLARKIVRMSPGEEVEPLLAPDRD
jgi:regulatory protein